MKIDDVVLRRFDAPDETRVFEKGRFEIVRVGGMTLGRATYEPGWRWSVHVGAKAGELLCEVEHVGMVVSGRATAAMRDGRVIEMRAGDIFYIAPGHDSWVVGDEPYVSFHFSGGDEYASAKTGRGAKPESAVSGGRLVELSHAIVHGMTTYPGLPAPEVSEHLTREASRALYGPGVEFQIGRLSLVGNTGTYVDSPFHRFEDGVDLAGLSLSRLANLEGVVVRVAGSRSRAVDVSDLAPHAVANRAVLVHTGWDRHWRQPGYGLEAPFLTKAAAEWLVAKGAALVGIDSVNIDDIDDRTRPVHTALLRAGLPIVEHLAGLEQLPVSGFRFHAAPPRIERFGTFPVRAYAVTS